MTAILSKSIANHDAEPRICIAGAGAIGIALALRLSLAGYEVNLLARGENLAVIQKNGISLVDASGAHKTRVTTGTVSELKTPDILFLCTKAQDLTRLGEAVQPLISDDTVIVPLVNGIPFWYFQGERGRFAGSTVNAVDPFGTLNHFFPARQIVGAVTMILAERIGFGVSRSFNPFRLIIGEIDNSMTPRVESLARILNASRISTTISARIRDPLWTKVIANLVSNPLSVLCDATLEHIFGTPSLLEIARKVFDEGLLAAASHGARVEFDFDGLARLGLDMGSFKTSMLQDYENGQPLELAAICGSVLELADLYQVAMSSTRDIATLAAYKNSTPRLRAVA
jgi:2-dehydropantoate 2-reductase